MFLYPFLGMKYFCESTALCFLLALAFTKQPGAALRLTARTLWLTALSAGLQTLTHYLCICLIPENTFVYRYIFWNLATLWGFWRLRLHRELPFASVMISYLLITDQFCQIFATYIIFYLRSNMLFVTEFGLAESLISTGIIWLCFFAMSWLAMRCAREIRSLLVTEAIWINVFIWCFLLIAVLLSRHFMQAQDHPLITVVIFALSLVEMALFFGSSMRIVRERDLGIEQARLNQQYALQMQHADEINALYQELRQIRHETKNQALYVEHLLKEKNYAALEAYYRDLLEQTSPLLHSYDSGNRLVNAIVWAKLRAAERCGIPMEVRAAVPENLPIKGHHLCSMLVNLLDNAIEASAHVQVPAVSMTLQMKQNYLFCCVANRIDEDVLLQNPELKTTKQDRLAHGFGIQSVKMIAELYDGITEFTTENGRFLATVMLSCGAVAQE